MVQLLLASKASVSARTNTGETPLHAALAEEVRSDFPDGTVRLLLEHGACLSATNRLGETPLHTAAENAWGHEAVVRLLLNRGAHVSAETKRGETPLHFAAHTGNQEVHPPHRCDSTPDPACPSPPPSRKGSWCVVMLAVGSINSINRWSNNFSSAAQTCVHGPSMASAPSTLNPKHSTLDIDRALRLNPQKISKPLNAQRSSHLLALNPAP